MTGEQMRNLAKLLFLLSAVAMFLASMAWALNGELAQAIYDGILALVGLLAYLVLRVGDLGHMIDLWLDRYETWDEEEWADEDEEAVR